VSVQRDSCQSLPDHPPPETEAAGERLTKTTAPQVPVDDLDADVDTDDQRSAAQPVGSLSQSADSVTEEAEQDPSNQDLDWQAILLENQSWLRRILFARLSEPEAVEECMQEVGLAAVRQAAPIRDQSKVGSWLYQLAVRQALLYRRKMGRRRNLLNRYAQRYEPTESDLGQFDPLKWLLDRERVVMVRAALGELSDGDREILLLKYAENWSYIEISEHLGVSHSAVEARLHRARQRLRRIIERLG